MAQPRWWSGRTAAVLDGLLAAALAGLGLAELLAWLPADGPAPRPLGLAVTAVVLSTAALAVRRRWPLAVAVGIFAVQIAPLPLPSWAGTPFWGGAVPAGVALYSVARHTAGHTPTRALLLPAALLLAYLVWLPGFTTIDDVAFLVLSLGAAWGAGRLLTRAQESNRRLAMAMDALERESAVRERAAAMGERARVARELHDVVAHSVSVMVVQAGAARMGLDDDTDAARSSLLAVESTGRQALHDLRRLLGVLKTGDAGADLAPQPTLAALSLLADRMCAAGLDVELREEGAPAPMSEGLELSAYRIVQEALTNALRHAGPTKVTIVIRHGPELEIDVCDEGPPDGSVGPARQQHGAGSGLEGMRERVSMFGGRIVAGRRGPGYGVHVWLPVGEPA
ncbi:MAG TPA: histidine kinase [Actinomycetales bacterium]|nr:histidine kinase [Actinomycetales bacterium]